ncbi:MAG: hypothetical protein IT308_08005 [Anaerolineaceae bacterium]|nr:hypothetical protein [Anaerolineaceae bacterium]
MKQAVSWLLVIILSAGCNLPRSSPTVEGSRETSTALARTLAAVQTQLAAGESPNISGIGTIQPTQPGHPPTIPPFVTLTPGPTRPAACERAALVREINIPAGSILPPGSRFTKTWELLNKGSCAWNSGFSFEFSGDGQAMGSASVPLLSGGEILPGQKGRVSLSLQVPWNTGSYQGSWKLRSPNGVLFGVGSDGQIPLTVHIQAENTYSFADHLCSARWQNAADSLECPMQEGDSRGFAIRSTAPEFETGSVDDEAALVMSPQNIPNGQISASFEPVQVPAGSHFRTIIGCYSGYPACNVEMILSYILEGGTEQRLAAWFERYDESVTQVEIDLDTYGLTGKAVSFQFKVRALEGGVDQRVIWLSPRLAP